MPARSLTSALKRLTSSFRSSTVSFVSSMSCVMALVLERLDHGLERLVIFVGPLLHAQHDVAVHLDEAAVAVPREARVAGLLRQRLDGLIVEPEVEDGVHHAGHRVAGAGADGHEQRILEVAELLLRLLLEGGDAGLHLRLERRRIAALVVVVVGADLGGDGESGRHGQADAAHLGEVGALAAEQRLHRAVAVGLLAEQVDELAGLRRLDFAAAALRRPWPSSPLLRCRLRLALAFRATCLRHLNSSRLLLAHLRNVRNLEDDVAQPCHQLQARGAQLRVLGHHQHVVEERRHRRTQRADRRERRAGSRGAPTASRIAGVRAATSAAASASFGRLRRARRPGSSPPRRHVLRDVLDPLEAAPPRPAAPRSRPAATAPRAFRRASTQV